MPVDAVQRRQRCLPRVAFRLLAMPLDDPSASLAAMWGSQSSSKPLLVRNRLDESFAGVYMGSDASHNRARTAEQAPSREV